MERKNPAHILFSRVSEQGFKCARRAQLNIDIFGARKKTQEQIVALLLGEIIGAAFSWIARGDDDWRTQDRHLAFELINHAAEMVESKLKKVRRLQHSNGKTKISWRSDDADQLWPCFFDRSAHCHILAILEIRKERWLLLL